MPNAAEIGGYMQVRGQPDPTVTDQKRGASPPVPAAGRHNSHVPEIKKEHAIEKHSVDAAVSAAQQEKACPSHYARDSSFTAAMEKPEEYEPAVRLAAKVCTADVPTEQPQLCRMCVRSVASDFPCLWLKR